MPVSIEGKRILFLRAALAASLLAGGSHLAWAQRAAENAVTQADDAFGTSVGNEQVGARVKAHLAQLTERLTAAQKEKPLTKEWARGWNQAAQALIMELIGSKPEPKPEPKPDEPGRGPTPQPPVDPLIGPLIGPDAWEDQVLLTKQVDAADPDEVSDFLAQVRRALESLGGPGDLTLRVRRKRGGR